MFRGAFNTLAQVTLGTLNSYSKSFDLKKKIADCEQSKFLLPGSLVKKGQKTN